MYRKIIVGYGHEEHTQEPIGLARVLATAGSIEVIIADVLDYYPYVWDESLIRELTREAERELAPATVGWPPGMCVSARAVPAMSAANGLAGLADSEAADLIILGPTHRGRIGQALLGTTSEQLLHGAPCAVALAPYGYSAPERGVQAIGVGYDGSEQAEVAVGWAVDAARALGAKLRLIAVMEPPPLERAVDWVMSRPPVDREALVERLRDHVRSLVDGALAALPPGLGAEATVREGHPVEEIRVAAAEDIDLLVLGSRGFGPLKSVLLGSVSAALARSSSVPTIVVPRAPTPRPSVAGRHGAGRPAGRTGARPRRGQAREPTPPRDARDSS